jgi:MYXO-CTERM domain-containing protein
MCGGVCTDIATSIDHCGQCDNPCSLPNANVACHNAVCTLISCLDGYEDANGIVADGCETQSDPEGGCNCRAADGEAVWGGLGLVGLLLGRRRRPSRSNRRHSCASRSQ